MTIHLKKLCVGIDSIADLAECLPRRIEIYDGQEAYPIYTRNCPRRDKEVLDGGSLYWIIKNRMAARQKILGFVPYQDEEGNTRHKIMLEPVLYETIKHPHRPFQGWRYLDQEKAPRDKGVFNPNDDEDLIPAELEHDLRQSGLI